MRKVEHLERQIRDLSSAEFAELRNCGLERFAIITGTRSPDFGRRR